jgi:AAA family ATP:ADP antiporter
VVSRGEKFKAKNIVDGSVFRAADAVNSWIFTLFSVVLALSIPVIAGISAIVAGGWALLSLWLGRHQERRTADQSKSG